MRSKHYDKILIEHIGIRQFFDSSKFSQPWFIKIFHRQNFVPYGILKIHVIHWVIKMHISKCLSLYISGSFPRYSHIRKTRGHIFSPAMSTCSSLPLNCTSSGTWALGANQIFLRFNVYYKLWDLSWVIHIIELKKIWCF